MFIIISIHKITYGEKIVSVSSLPHIVLIVEKFIITTRMITSNSNDRSCFKSYRLYTRRDKRVFKKEKTEQIENIPICLL